jgi:hypothetical protein
VHTEQLCSPFDVRPLRFTDPCREQLAQLELLALKSIGMARVVGEHGEIELRALVRLVNAHLPRRAAPPQVDERRRETVFLEHIQRGRMKCRGAHVALNPRLGLDHGAGNPECVEPQGRRQADRPGSDDQYALVHAWHADDHTFCMRRLASSR